MTLPELSIKRPIFISSLVILMIVGGIMSMRNLPVDLFPNIEFPYVAVFVTYPGTGPSEMENLVARPIEEELSTISGLKRLTSQNNEGVSLILSKFDLNIEVKDAEQQIRDRISAIRRKLPKDIEEPVIKRFDPSDNPIIMMALESPQGANSNELYDIADQLVKPQLEHVKQVSHVDIYGGRKREIQIQLDRKKLAQYELSATQVADKLSLTGENIPLGKINLSGKDVIYRSIGEFENVEKIEDVIIKFFGNDVPVRVKDIGRVVDTKQDEKGRAFINGKSSLFLWVYRQSGANTVRVADEVVSKVPMVNKILGERYPGYKLNLIRDGAIPIRNNLFDVKESIFIGIVLAVFVVFLFLLNMRSTIITGLALPNSLIGAFIFIAACGFSYNTLTLLAMSLAVGLLIDDAIVVRENIFRHLEMGKTPKNAALDGTKEVSLAVIATTLTVMSVFGSMAFVGGITGRFMKEFGFTVVFAMAISLFDGLAVAPMLSAYFSGTPKNIKEEKIHWTNKLEDFYVKILGLVLKHPLKVLGSSFIIFVLSMASAKFIPKSFIPNADNGEIEVKMDLVPGTTLDQMQETSLKVSEILKKNKEVELVSLWVGDKMGGNNKATMFVKLVPPRERSLNTSQVKDRLREQLKPFAYANSIVKDFDLMFGGERPFILNIIGTDIKKIEGLATELKNKMMMNPLFKEPDVSFRPGMPELQIKLNDNKATQYGISSNLMGGEIRAQIEGVVAAKYRDEGKEYDIRVRLQENQRNLQEDFDQTLIPNLNYRLIGLPNVATKTMEMGSTTINRFDRSRFVQVTADLGTKGGIGDAVAAAKDLLEKQVKIPTGVSYAFDGQAEEFGEMMKNMILAGVLAILFIFLVLASLYDSFITPFSIMLALPLALCGAFVALLITGESINLFSIITCIMLFGIATKNSILLVDYTGQLEQAGMERKEALFTAGRRRLRPILMTSMALIAGALPLAIGLNEASTQRVSMGIAMIGGVVSSTILTLLVVPAAYSYVERLKHWVRSFRKA